MKLRVARVVGFISRMHSRLSFFTVAKKDNMLRLMVDYGEANSLHKPPPASSLAIAGVFANFYLSDRFQNVEESENEGNALDVHVCSTHLIDGYYQFGFDYMCPFFCIPLELQPCDFKVLEVLGF